MTKYIVLMCLFLQACSLDTLWMTHKKSRTPASVKDYTDIKNKMQTFKNYIVGVEETVDCDHRKKEEELKRLMTAFKQNSCSSTGFSFDRDFEQEVCKRVKAEGLITKLVKQVVTAEKKKQQQTSFKGFEDKEFKNLHLIATSYLKVIQTEAFDPNVQDKDKAELIAFYVGNVLLPMRELVVIKRAYLAKEANGQKELVALLPRFPTDFAENLPTELHGLLTQGPNPSADPYSMEIVEIGKGSSALQFAPTEIIRRDIMSILKAPTAKNYVLGLKWMTLHMMLSQIYIYDTILGNKKAFSIPESCQNHLNGDLPKSFNFKFEEGMSDQFLEGILSSHGLTFKQDDMSYLDYYIDNVNKDPTREGYSGIVPFETYKSAKVALGNQSGTHATMAEFDDVAHFQSVVNAKMQDVQGVFKGKRAGKVVTFEGIEDFKKIMGSFEADEIADITLKDGTTQSIYPGKQNLSPYLLEIMKKDGLTDYTQFFTENLKKEFRNRKVAIPFPSMYSSPVWRDWSLKVLADYAQKYSTYPETHTAPKIVRMACERVGGFNSKEVFQICSKGNKIQNLSNFLAEFRSGDAYIPTRRLEERRFQEVYPFLSLVWSMARDLTEDLPEAKPFELNFLLDQMSAGNPWARLKLSYMVAIDQFQHQIDGIPPVYSWQGFSLKTNRDAFCDKNLTTQKLAKIKKAGIALGLHLPLNYGHANRLLTKDEKKSIWYNIADDMNSRNAQLLSVKHGSVDYYKSIENVSYKTILTEEAAKNSGVALSARTNNEFQQVSSGIESKLSKFFLELYKLKGKKEEQAKLFEQFSEINGFDSSFSMKLNFLATDEAYKKVIYKDLLRQAALSRKMQITSKIDSFCKMSVDDQKQFKNIFYSTTKSQNELNQISGLPSIPENVLEKVNEMTDDEWRDMWWGIGSGVAGIAAIVVGGACTTVTGGLCAPLGGAMAAAGLASLGIQVKLTANEVERKMENDLSEAQVKQMEDLGFANLGSSDEIHRGWGWAAFEALSIFPLIGVATRSAVLGPKLVVKSTQSMLRKTGKSAFKASAKTAVEEEEVRLARFVLGMDSAAKNAGVDPKMLASARSKIDKVKALYTAGKIDLATMQEQIAKIIDPIKRAKRAVKLTTAKEIGRVTVNESREVIDRKTTEVIYDYFGGNSKELLRLIQSYSGERLTRANRVMGELVSTDRIGNRIPIYSGVRDWFLRMRNESLAKNSQKILALEKELANLPNNKEAFKKFLAKNVDNLTEVFMDIPMRKRELPYIIQVQGMPHFNLFGGRKIPLLSTMSEGQILKKIYQSRARLVYESYKSQARLSLKIPRRVQSDRAVEVFKQFQLSVAELASRKSSGESRVILKQYRNFENKMLEKMYSNYTKSGQKLDFVKFRELVLRPKNVNEEAISDTLWSSIPEKELFGHKDLTDIAHLAVKELAGYTDINSFERYLNAMKVLIVQRSPQVLEIM